MTKINPYKDDYIKASENLRLVLGFLSKHKIPGSPINYQIAYDFISGNNTQLIKALEQILEQEGKLTENELLSLYKQFIIQDDKSLESVRQELQKIITYIQSEYDDSSGKLSDYLGSLNNFNEALSGSGQTEELSAEIQKVIEDTRSTESSQRKFESQMSNMMKEVETLHKQLEQVREDSLTDALTGIANRKAFDEELERVFQHSHENKLPFCVVIADIDYFKKFNDTYGHLVGDKVLRFVAITIKSCVKGKDMAARFGGEEFVLILPETDITGAGAVAEQVRIAVSKCTLKDQAKNKDFGKITISLGIAQFKPSDQPKDVLKRADQALYQAKENGRNRVETEGSTSIP